MAEVRGAPGVVSRDGEFGGGVRVRRAALMASVGVLLVTVFSCGATTAPTAPGPEDDPSCTAALPALASIGDVGNTGGGADLAVRTGPIPASSCTSEVRLFLAPESAPVTDVAGAEAVPSERTLQLDPGFGGGLVDFGAVGVDASGATLVEGVPYRLGVLAVGPDRPAYLAAVTPVTLRNENVVRTVSPVIQAGSGGLETDADGNVYTADFGATLQGPPGDRIHRVTPDGEVSVFATGFTGASGNDRAANGDLFQSSIQAGTIHRVTPEGTVSTFATGIQGPVGIVALPGDTLFVASCGDNTIRRVEPDGTVSTLAASDLFGCPNGITEAPDGHLYVANFGNGAVTRVTRAGDVSVLMTVPSGNAGHILWGLGALWVVDRGGNRLLRVQLDGTWSAVAGSGERGVDDGPALAATLSLTNDVAFSPDSTRLWFNDVAKTSGPQNEISPVLVRALVFERPGANPGG